LYSREVECQTYFDCALRWFTQNGRATIHTHIVVDASLA
jgi:hypothetical protein